VRRTAVPDAGSCLSRRFGFRRHYRMTPWTDFVEVHWGVDCQIYVTPVSQDEVGIAVLSRDSRLHLADALPGFPELQRRLQGARPSSLERGAVTVSRRLRRVFRGHTVLVGDAAGSVDAITGEGLSICFNQAVALSEALYSGDLESYQAAHSRLARPPALAARILLLCARFPRVRRTIWGMLAHEPVVFGRLLTGYASNET
jgi:flavin-dependent dehydrogenase